MPQSPSRTPSMPEMRKSRAVTDDWRLGLTLAEQLEAAGETLRPTAKALRRRRMHWREERRAAIARARKLAALSAVEPRWWREFWACYRASTAHAGENGLLVALHPIIAPKTASLRSQLSCGGSSLYPSSEKSVQELALSFEEALRDRLALAVTKTLVLELAVAGRAGLLKGDTPEARFAFFCDCLKDPAFAARLLAQYPVLVRRCVAIATGCEEASRSLLARLAASESKLIAVFFDNKDPGRLASVEASGDVHGRGQATHVLSFESGAKLVYKPRPVAMEQCYYDFVAWLNDRGLDPELKVARTLDEGKFGWMEFVPVAPCVTRADVNRFFARMGAHLALTSLLGGTDLHSENVIAHGEHPIPVDLETLFHADPLPENLSGASARGWAALRQSVVRTLMLPEARGFSDKPEDWVDMSALGHGDEQLTPMPVANWARAETDRMRLIYRRATIPQGFSLPQFAGQQVQAAAYADDVVQGFVQAYELLRKLKTELVAPQGPLSAFAGKPTRRVFRDTTIYALTLFSSYHPRFQGDAIACEAMLRDALRAAAGDGQPWLKLLEDAEAAELLACDIPYFVSTVGSTDVSAIGGQAAIALSGDTRSWPRIETMNERDLERQAWLIRVAMQDPAKEAAAAAMDIAQAAGAPSPETLIATAARIGDRICELAIEDGDRCTWLVPELVNSRRLATTVAGFGLYDGLSGIALFLAHLGATTGEGRYGRMADAAMREARALCRKQNVSSARLGAFQDIGGFCYALVHLAAITGRSELAAEASAIIRRFAASATRTSDLDLIAGVAGFVVAGLAVARFNRDSALVETLGPSAERLYRLAASPRRTLPILAESETGLAHGRAGAALALLRWAETIGEARFRTAGKDLLRTDFAVMESARRNPSAQAAADHPADDLGWCRGSLGIAMAALAAHPPVTGLFDAAWIESVAREMAHSRPSALCLCHGALGRLEFISFAGRRLFGDDCMDELDAWRAALLGEIVGGHWVADWAHALESPGFMLGLAGTGYSLLRQAFGDRVPSVLLLEDAATLPS
jgi:type 2 lantibiotic biosynthesis protein LanM